MVEEDLPNIEGNVQSQVIMLSGENLIMPKSLFLHRETFMRNVFHLFRPEKGFYILTFSETGLRCKRRNKLGEVF